MRDVPQLLSVILPLTTLLGIVFAYFRYKPGQREAVRISVDDAALARTDRAFELVVQKLEGQIARMDTDLSALRNRVAAVERANDELEQANDALREDLRAVKGKLVTAVQQRDELRVERDMLRDRVTELEARVGRVEGSQP